MVGFERVCFEDESISMLLAASTERLAPLQRFWCWVAELVKLLVLQRLLQALHCNMQMPLKTPYIYLVFRP